MNNQNPHLSMKTTLWFLLTFLGILAACRHTSPSKPDYANRHQLDSTITYCNKIDTLKQMLPRFREQHDRRSEMLTLSTLGKRHREASQFEEAINYHQAALYLAEELQDTVEIINILNQQGTNYRRIGNLDEASECLYRALSCYETFSGKEERKVRKFMVSVLNGIGNVQKELNNREDAMDFFRRALKAETEMGNTLGQAINYANIGSIMREMNETDSAKIYYSLSLEANQRVRSKVGIALCYISFGELYHQEGNLTRALKEYKAAYDLLLTDKDRWHWFISCTSMANIYLQLRNLAEASRYIDEAMREAERMKSLRSLRDAYELKSLYEEQRGRYAEAQQYYKLAVAYQDSVTNEKNLNHMQNLRVNFEREKSRQATLLMRTEQENQQQFYFIIILSLVMAVVLALSGFLLIHLRSRRRHISELRQKNEELVAMHQRLERAETVKTLFIQNITHELRTPLNAISGFAQTLTIEGLSLEDRKLCSTHIEKNTRLLTKLVGDILDLSSMETGQLNLHTGPVVAQELIRSVTLHLQGQVHEGVELRLDLPHTPITLQSDTQRLSQILSNLLSNACKNTTEGHITLKLAKDDEWVRFSVTDTGCGVPADKAELIFERFAKVDHFKQGAGLGLSICRFLSEAMGGRLYLDTAYVGGARFVLELPH